MPIILIMPLKWNDIPLKVRITYIKALYCRPITGSGYITQFDKGLLHDIEIFSWMKMIDIPSTSKKKLILTVS